MIDRIDDLPFPSGSDFDALIDDAGPAGLRSVLAEEGVFYLGRREEWPHALRRFVFGQRWYAEAFHTPQAMINGTVFAGARTKISSLDVAVAAAQDLVGLARSTTHSPVVSAVFKRDGVDVVQIKYTKNRAFRTEYYRREFRTVDLRIEELEGNIRLVGFPTSATDAMIMRDVANAIVDKATAELDEIDFEKLTHEEKIDLIDRILEDRKSLWRVRDVVSLAVRRSKSAPDESLEEGDVRALSAALLSGSSLRKLSMVQDLIDAGCYFAMVRVLAFAPGLEIAAGDVDVEIAFKQSPEVLMITVRTTKQLRQNDDGTQSEEAVKTAFEVAESVARFYWGQLHRCFDSIVEAH